MIYASQLKFLSSTFMLESKISRLEAAAKAKVEAPARESSQAE